MKKYLSLLLLSLLLSCESGEKEILYILSDTPEIVQLVEFYNIRHEETGIIVNYTDYITPQKLKEGRYDLVISKDLLSPEYWDYLTSNRNIKKVHEGLYTALTDFEEGKNPLIPLAFDLPLIVYREDHFSPEPPPLMISPSQLEEWNQTVIEEDGFTHLGFSPSWNPEYLLFLLRTKGETFHAQGEFTYNEPWLSSEMDNQRQWIEENQGEQAVSFSIKYRYIPDVALIKQNRIDFVAMGLAEYFQLQESLRQGLNFSYLSINQKIRPMDILFGAIPKRSRNSRKAEVFFLTILDPQFQNDYIQWKNSQRDSSFGYLGGLFSLVEQNHFNLPHQYEQLGIRIFSEESLLPAISGPTHWKAIHNEMLPQWFYLYFEESQSMSLEEFHQEWELHFIP